MIPEILPPPSLKPPSSIAFGFPNRAALTRPDTRILDIAAFPQRPLLNLSMAKGTANPPHPSWLASILPHVVEACQAASKQRQIAIDHPHGEPADPPRQGRESHRLRVQVRSPVDHPLWPVILIVPELLIRIGLNENSRTTRGSIASPSARVETAVRDLPHGLPSAVAPPPGTHALSRTACRDRPEPLDRSWSESLWCRRACFVTLEVR